MTRARGSFFVAGILLSALVFFGSTTAQAQAPPTNPVGNVGVTPLGHDRLLVKWTVAVDAPGVAVPRKDIQVGHLQHDSATEFGAGSPITTVVAPSFEQAEITGLSAGKRYIIGVRARPGTPATPGAKVVNQVWTFPQPTHVETTLEAPTPETILERDIHIDRGDMDLTVKWDEPRPDSTSRTSTLTIIEYQVAFDVKADGSTHKVWPFALTSRVAVVDRLENDTKYYVAVRSKNSAGGWSKFDWSEAAEAEGRPKRVPALPLFGVLALGAGLMAAGRRRLRAQRLLKR